MRNWSQEWAAGLHEGEGLGRAQLATEQARRRQLEQAPLLKVKMPSMRVRLLERGRVIGPGKVASPGDVVEMDSDIARGLIDVGQAERV
jgi:hypothetical protein